MRDPNLKPLPDDIADLLASASRPQVPSEMSERLLQRIQVTLALPVEPLEPGESVPESVDSPVELASVTKAAPLVAKLGTLGLPLSVVSLVTGLAAGVVLDRTVLAPPPSPPPQIEPVKVEIPKVEAPPVPSELPAPPPPVEKRKENRDVTRVEPKPVAERDLTLADERALIEMARTALAKKEFSQARTVLLSHAQRFAFGQLAEERESLWVQLEVNAGNFTAARKRAEDFRSQFPDSVLLPVVEQALREIP